jgi:hypothetical protein
MEEICYSQVHQMIWSRDIVIPLQENPWHNIEKIEENNKVYIEIRDIYISHL